jgi:adenylosuccinate synthase
VGPTESFLEHHQAREYGTTTGRKRRIGWFDAVLVKTAVRLNGLDSIALTKLDVLDELDEIKICVAYQLKESTLENFPSIAEDLEDVIPVYETIPGWKSSTAMVKHYDELPSAAKNYLSRIQELCRIPISMISTGPERESTLILRNVFKTLENSAC